MNANADTLCVVGDGLYKVHQPGGPTAPAPTVVSTARYRPETREWIAIDEHKLSANGQMFSRVFCQGGQIIVVPVGPTQLRTTTEGILWFDPARETWEAVPAVPETFADATPARVGETRVLWTGNSGRKYWLLDKGASAWRGTEKPFTVEASIESTGRQMLIHSADASDVAALLDPVLYARDH